MRFQRKYECWWRRIVSLLWFVNEARSVLGTIFVFRSKRADRLKIVAWDGSGLGLQSALAHHVHRIAPMGAPVLINGTRYKTVSITETSDVRMVLDEGNVKELAVTPPPSSDRVPVTNSNRLRVVDLALRFPRSEAIGRHPHVATGAIPPAGRLHHQAPLALGPDW